MKHRVYATEILGRNGRPILGDWRRKGVGLHFSKAELPDVVADTCVEITQRNGLHFGAIDLVKSGGDFYFLEINPSGEWGWLQTSAGLPIAEAIADWLISPETQLRQLDCRHG